MSIDAAAERLARFLEEQRYVEVYGHHDADGVVAASIICHALRKRGIGFRLRVVDRVPDLDGGAPALLCDLGAGLEDLPSDVAVLDHHAPVARGDGAVLNPHAVGLDGERVLCAAALAFLVANRFADCRDLAGLAVAGMLGDGQAFEGENAEILNDGLANGVIELAQGIRLPGTTIGEQLELAIDPFLPGISGNADRVRELLRASMGEDGPELDRLLSLIVLDTVRDAAPGAIEALWGDRVVCLREVLADATTLSAVVDACGKSGRGGLAASVCLRSPGAVEEARKVAAGYRRRVIGAIAGARPVGESTCAVLIDDPALVGDVATALAGPAGGPVLVAARNGDMVRVSTRADGAVPLGPLVRQLASEAGGSGGGHARRAGGSVPADGFLGFAAAFAEAVGA
ncbi:MAG TPA: DHHA1 domain-containing protein [Methanoregulaceae archaeon]|nr:DHHA1 domain-containing protein [Methanoregulaceae archaeon]